MKNSSKKSGARAAKKVMASVDKAVQTFAKQKPLRIRKTGPGINKGY